jgi:hypothetical protein
LMGSVTSFPILCIINATLCRYAMELSDGEIRSLDDARLMINGDDCLFRINSFGKTIWENLGAYIGLEPSVGKVYYSKEYMNINSTSFFIGQEHQISCKDLRSADPDAKFERSGLFTIVPYINLGLLNGLTRSGTLEVKPQSDPFQKSVGAKAHKLVSGHSNERQVKIMKKFINHNWDKLNEVYVPWFMPEWIGGLGLPWVGPNVGGKDITDIDEYKANLVYEFGPSELDLLKAHNILLNWRHRSPQSIPASSEWKIHEYAMSRLPVKPERRRIQKGQKVPLNDFDKLYASLCNETLLAEFPDEFLGSTTQRDVGIQVLRKNEKLWTKTKPLRPACSLESLVPRTTFNYLPCVVQN